MKLRALFCIAAPALILAGQPAFAGDKDKDDSAKTAQSDKDRIKCKRVRETGSRVSKKFCMKVSEWEALAERERNDAEALTTNGVRAANDGAGG